MYGQDADLIMLGLATHEPHFTILREVVDFTPKSKQRPSDVNSLVDTIGSTAAPLRGFDSEKLSFQLLHLSVLREYIEVEFCHKHRGPPLDRERLVDDFVFLTFLVGNDFVPHIPSMDIGENAFDIIFDGYKSLQSKGPVGYIVDNGEIGDFDRLEKLFAIIGRQEEIVLRRRDIGNKKRSSQLYAVADMQASPDYTVELDGGQLLDGEEDGMESEEENVEDELDLSDFEEDVEEEAGSEEVYAEGSNDVIEFDGTVVEVKGPAVSSASHSAQNFGQYIPTLEPNSSLSNIIDTGRISSDHSLDKSFNYRDHHYKAKFGVEPGSPEQYATVQKITEEYLKGLMWCLSYYFKGCVSWSWYYPYYYGPTLIDMKNLFLKAAMAQFSLDEPFTPNQQLLGCLPPISANILPSPYRPLMTSPDSPIIDFYPKEFVEDMDGKRLHWEAVILLKFIDSQRLKDAEKAMKCLEKLTPEERARNKFGAVHHHHVSSDSTIVAAQKIPFNLSPQPPFRSNLVPGTLIPYHGFPSLRALPIQNVSMRLLRSKKAFGGRYKSLILGIGNKLCEVGSSPPESLVGRRVFVNYPLMREARVVAVSTRDKKYHFHEDGSTTHTGEGPRVRAVELGADEKGVWAEEAEKIKQLLLLGNENVGTAGMELQGKIRTRLLVTPVVGTRVNPTTGVTEKVYSDKVLDVPIQMVKWKSPVMKVKRPLHRTSTPGANNKRQLHASLQPPMATTARNFTTIAPRSLRSFQFVGLSGLRFSLQSTQSKGLRTLLLIGRKLKF